MSNCDLYCSKMRPGDLVFFKGNTLPGRLIQSYCKFVENTPPFDHVGMVRWEYGKAKILEASYPCSREVMLSNKLQQFRGEAAFVCVNTGLGLADDAKVREDVIRNAVCSEGLQYQGIYDMMRSFITKRFGNIEHDNRFYCSEYVATAWALSGVCLNDTENVTPGRLFSSSKCEVIGRLQS